MEEDDDHMRSLMESMGLPTAFGGRPLDADGDSEEPKVKSAGKLKKEAAKKEKRQVQADAMAAGLESKQVVKYWAQRKTLWHRYDEGIRMDLEGWYSVTPEDIANEICEVLLGQRGLSWAWDLEEEDEEDGLWSAAVVLDGMAGVGGNTIAFARTGVSSVIAWELDSLRAACIAGNAGVYEVDDVVEVVIGNWLEAAGGGRLIGDVVFLSPPWGGPQYLTLGKKFPLDALLPIGFDALLQVAAKVRGVAVIALFLPRNTDLDETMEQGVAVLGDEWVPDCEAHYVSRSKYPKAVTVWWSRKV